MEYGSIIKRAWKITWTYRYLWVLGLFAGITGMGSGRVMAVRETASRIARRVAVPAVCPTRMRSCGVSRAGSR